MREKSIDFQNLLKRATLITINLLEDRLLKNCELKSRASMRISMIQFRLSQLIELIKLY